MSCKSKWKRSLVLLLSTAILLSACKKNDQEVETTTTAEATTTAAETETQPSFDLKQNPEETLNPFRDEIRNQLEELNSVTQVVPCSDPTVKNYQYEISFNMPIDHHNPQEGYFTIRVYARIQDLDAPNVFYVGGYELYYGLYDEEASQLADRYNCNFFEAEYRFYGHAMPADFKYDNPDYWEFINCDQAAEDFHSMIRSLKNMFTGKWCFEGLSKGGEMVVYQLAAHPEDADIFVAESAMLNDRPNCPGMYEYFYTEAGDLIYGEEQAQEYRDLVTAIQVEAIKHREEVQPLYIERAKEEYGLLFNTDYTDEILFDCTVLDLTWFWQYPDEWLIKEMQDALAQKDASTPEAQAAFYRRLVDILDTVNGPYMYCITSKKAYETPEPSAIFDGMYTFNFQCFQEDGYYYMDFSYLREALAAEGIEDLLCVTEEMEPDVWAYRIYNEHEELYPYDPTVHDMRLSVLDTTEKPLLLMNSLSDAHSVAEVMECDNPNVHIFIIPDALHDEVEWDALSDEQLEEYDALIKEALNIQ